MELTYADGQPLLLNELLYHCIDYAGMLKLTFEKGIQAATFQLLPYTHHQCENKIEFEGSVHKKFEDSQYLDHYPFNTFVYNNHCLSFKSIDYSAKERDHFNSLTRFYIILWGACQCPFSLQIDLTYEEKVISQCFTFVMNR
jgi:hypothetical protein